MSRTWCMLVVERRGGEGGAERARCRVGAGPPFHAQHFNSIATAEPQHPQSHFILPVTCTTHHEATCTKKVSNATDAPMLWSICILGSPESPQQPFILPPPWPPALCTAVFCHELTDCGNDQMAEVMTSITGDHAALVIQVQPTLLLNSAPFKEREMRPTLS